MRVGAGGSAAAGARVTTSGPAGGAPGVRWRWALRVGMAAGVALVIPAAIWAPPSVAATGLRVVGSAEYTVNLEGHRVDVRVDLQVANTTRETVSHRYWVDRFTLLIPPEAEGFQVAASGWSPSIRVLRRPAAALLMEVDLGGRLWSGRSVTVTLGFQLPDRGGPPLRPVRVGAGVIAFPVWAFASDGASGASVAVTIPSGYQVTASLEAFPRRSVGPDGATRLATGPLARPTRFSASLIAEGEGTLVEQGRQVTVAGRPVALRLRWWADDPGWGDAEGAVVADALATLGRLTGRPYLGPQPVVVTERAATALAGLSARVDPASGRLDLAWSADPLSVVAAVARLVVNGSLVAEGWAVDGFADLLAFQLATAMGLPVARSPGGPATVEPGPGVGPPLNAVPAEVWSAPLPGLGGASLPGAGAVGGRGPVGAAPSIPGRDDLAARRAALAVAREVLARLPVDGHGSPWGRFLDAVRGRGGPASMGEEAVGWSGPAVAAAAGTEPVDWRGLLDRLEAAAGRSFRDLWETWIVTPAQRPLIDRRAAADARFHRLAGGDPPPGAAVAMALAAWQFDEADALMAQVEVQQVRRRRLLALAAGLALSLPAPGDPEALRRTLDDELRAVETVAVAVAARPSALDPVRVLGILGRDPDRRLATARAALAAGRFADAEAAATEALRVWQEATDLGRRRLTAVGIALGIVGLGIGWLGSPGGRWWLGVRYTARQLRLPRRRR